MIIAIPFRGQRPNKNVFRSQTFFEILKIPNENKLAENKKAHSVRVGRIFSILIAFTETPPATHMSGP
jgi:hypothetical protein